MRFRKLRIAWSVLWGVVAVLLCVLWVQSYSRFGSIVVPSHYKSSTGRIESGYGKVLVTWQTHDYPRSWEITSSRIFSSNMWREWRWHFSSEYVEIGCPYWALVVASAAVAACSWLRWRFSVRTLLIATTLVAVVLGAIVYASR
jgi:hypothetical protein